MIMIPSAEWLRAYEKEFAAWRSTLAPEHADEDEFMLELLFAMTRPIEEG